MRISERAFTRRRIAAVFAWVVASGPAVALVGCGQPGDDASSPATQNQISGSVPAPGSDLGSVALDLDLGSGVQITSVAYDISGGSFHRTGTIDVSKSATASTIVDGIPFGTAYVATLSASSTGTPHVDCSGSASFDVAAAGVTSVPVHLTCREAPTAPPPPAPVPFPSYAALALWGLLLTMGAAMLGRAAPGSNKRPSRFA